MGLLQRASLLLLAAPLDAQFQQFRPVGGFSSSLGGSRFGGMGGMGIMGGSSFGGMGGMGMGTQFSSPGFNSFGGANSINSINSINSFGGRFGSSRPNRRLPTTTTTAAAPVATTTTPAVPVSSTPSEASTPSAVSGLAGLAPVDLDAKNKIQAFYSTREEEVRLPASSSSPGPEVTEEPKKIKEKKKGALYLWNQTQLRSYNLVMRNADFQKLESAPAAESYVPCSIQTDYGTPQQQTFENTGCRYKGSVGSLRICLDSNTGRLKAKSCRKLSWKVNADRYVPAEDDKQEIYKQDKLVFNGMAVDYSLMSERLAYALIKEAGIKGPLASHAKIYVNGRYDGVYSIVEAPDDEFTKRLWKKDENDGEGGLYKDPVLGHSLDPEYFQRHFQSGKDETDFLVEVSAAMQRAKPSEYKAVMYKYFDVASVIDVTAINMLFGATDDWRMRHNFFWYVHEVEIEDPNKAASAGQGNKQKKKKKKKDMSAEEKAAAKAAKKTMKKLVMIPWDYDRINDDNAKDRKPPGTPPNWWNPLPANDIACLAPSTSAHDKALAQSMGIQNEYNFWLAIFETLPGNVDTPINCDVYTRHLSSLKDEIFARMRQLSTTVVTDANINRKMNMYAEQIDSAVRSDPDEPTYYKWKSSMAELKRWFKNARREALNPESYVQGSAGFGVMDPEFLDILGITAQDVAGAMTTGGLEALQPKTNRAAQELQRYQGSGKTGFLTGPMAPNAGGVQSMMGAPAAAARQVSRPGNRGVNRGVGMQRVGGMQMSGSFAGRGAVGGRVGGRMVGR